MGRHWQGPLALGLVVASAVVAAPAFAQEEPDRYEGTATVEITPSKFNPNFPETPPDQGPEKALVNATCSAGSCTIAEEPLGGGIHAFWDEGVEYPLTVPIGGSVELPRERSSVAGGENCDGLEVPPGVLTVSMRGDTLTLVADLPEYTSSNGDCVTWYFGRKTTFTGELVERGEEQGSSSQQGTSSTAGPQDEPTGSRTDARDEDGSSSQVAVLVGGAVGGLALAGGVAALLLRRRPRSLDPEGAAGTQPQVRPAHDPGRQSIVPSGPSASVQVLVVADGGPRTSITQPGTGPTIERS